MQTLYNFGIFLFTLLLRLLAGFNHKINLTVSGRKDWKNRLQVLANLKLKGEVIWFHCASVGEFEQARPLIEMIKKEFPNTKILLTFFSPSGYELRKNYEFADLVFYLPFDTKSNAEFFIAQTKPKMVYFVKYEFWHHFVNEAKKQNVKIFLLSGIFREKQHFFKQYGAFFRKMLSNFSHFYLQDKKSLDLLASIGFENTSLTGDTRFDRVWAIKEANREIPIVEKFKDNKPLLIVGSSWTEDIELLSLAKLNVRMVIAPHEITEANILHIEKSFSNTLKFSQAQELDSFEKYDVLIIDNVGMLSALYRYGTYAYVGGAFGDGLHNILEPAVFGLPVFFGKKYDKFQEAIDLVNLNVAFSVKNAEELNKKWQEINQENSTEIKNRIELYVKGHLGASEKVFADVKHLLKSE